MLLLLYVQMMAASTFLQIYTADLWNLMMAQVSRKVHTELLVQSVKIQLQLKFR